MTEFWHRFMSDQDFFYQVLIVGGIIAFYCFTFSWGRRYE